MVGSILSFFKSHILLLSSVLDLYAALVSKVLWLLYLALKVVAAWLILD